MLAGCASNTTSTSIDMSTVPLKAEDTTPLKVGAKAPLMTLRAPDGSAYDLAAAVSEKPAVLIFYRGGWCPYCNRQLVALQDIEDELFELGYTTYAISPDRPEKLRQSINDKKLSYTLLSDSTMEMTHAFGLAFKLDNTTLARYREYDIDLQDASGQTHPLLPVPAVYIVATDGTIRFSHSNPDYKTRLEPEKIIEAAKRY
jgi:peroxiredoxin